MDLLSSRPIVEDMERAKDFIAASLMLSLRDERRWGRDDEEPPEEETRRLPPPLP